MQVFFSASRPISHLSKPPRRQPDIKTTRVFDFKNSLFILRRPYLGGYLLLPESRGLAMVLSPRRRLQQAAFGIFFVKAPFFARCALSLSVYFIFFARQCCLSVTRPCSLISCEVYFSLSIPRCLSARSPVSPHAMTLTEDLELGAREHDIRQCYRRGYISFPLHEPDIPGHIFNAFSLAEDQGFVHALHVPTSVSARRLRPTSSSPRFFLPPRQHHFRVHSGFLAK